MKHKIKFPSLLFYDYKLENSCYRIVFAEERDYTLGYNSGSLYVRTPLTKDELKTFISNRIDEKYPGLIKIENVVWEDVQYMNVISLQKLSWYIKNIIVFDNKNSNV